MVIFFTVLWDSDSGISGVCCGFEKTRFLFILVLVLVLVLVLLFSLLFLFLLLLLSLSLFIFFLLFIFFILKSTLVLIIILISQVLSLLSPLHPPATLKEGVFLFSERLNNELDILSNVLYLFGLTVFSFSH